jgi:hypothetical protein
MAQRHLIDKCNGNCYICVIGEVEDYYGVHEIIAFNVRPVSRVLIRKIGNFSYSVH